MSKVDLGRWDHPVAQTLQVPAQIGQRRTQLMGYVGHHGLAQLLQLRQIVGHVIKRSSQTAHFITGCHRYPGSEDALSHLTGDSRHLGKGTEYLAGEQIAEQHGQYQSQPKSPKR